MRTPRSLDVLILLSSLLPSCARTPERAATATEDTGAPDEPACEVVVLETVPSDGEGDTYGRAPVEFHLSAPDATAVVVADFPGVQSDRDGGRVIVYTPTDPLEPESGHEATLEFCGGSPSIRFTTSDVGQALDDPSSLVGRVYAPDFRAARFLDGDRLSEVAMALFPQHLLVGVVEVAPGALGLRVAVGTDGTELVQDPCFRTLDLPVADFDDVPWFDLDAGEVAFEAWEGTVLLQELHADGTFEPDGDAIAGIRASVTADVRDFVDLMDVGDADALCELAERLGSACAPCPTDGVSACVVIEVDQLEALAVDAELVPIDDPAIDLECL